MESLLLQPYSFTHEPDFLQDGQSLRIYATEELQLPAKNSTFSYRHECPAPAFLFHRARELGTFTTGILCWTPGPPSFSLFAWIAYTVVLLSWFLPCRHQSWLWRHRALQLLPLFHHLSLFMIRWPFLESWILNYLMMQEESLMQHEVNLTLREENLKLHEVTLVLDFYQSLPVNHP